MTDANKLVKQLQRRGPHRVLQGDLGVAGVPGLIYTPESGVNLPAVAFAHDWVTPVKRYRKTLEHLASWGLVVAAPDTEGGVLPSDGKLALDLGTALDVITEVRLGTGDITVNKAKRAVAGHAWGTGAALIAAAADPRIEALAALYPAPTSPRAEQASATVLAQAMILARPGDEQSMTSNAGVLSMRYGGPTELRLVPDSEPGGLAEGLSVRGALGAGGADKSTQKIVRALLTGFLLGTVGDQKDYKIFAELDADWGDTSAVWTPHAEPEEPSLLQKVRSLA
ncbi:dienelactone hydrolase family protein [Tsukamurella sp. 1534]|uniref:dienelactone hydrolase family protein n=1 Tax=Tsukamurella sp. 1534 TaxID=1151061 RepID=UPI000313F01E|nr:dienelactone hydrolase family protein [Tsukamurella sp. 1534]